MSGRLLLRRILIVDDQRENRVRYAELALHGTLEDNKNRRKPSSPIKTEVAVATSGIEACDLLCDARDSGHSFDVLVVDLNMPGFSGLELIDRLIQNEFEPRTLEIILVSRADDAPSLRAQIAAADARWRRGTEATLNVVLRADVEAADTLRNHSEEFLNSVRRQVWDQMQRSIDDAIADSIRRSNDYGKQKAWSDVFVTGNPNLHKLVERCLTNDAPTKARLILEGESGVGKDLLAELIHMHSPRVGKPLVPCFLTSLPDTLIESTLFGHERGAFTGADRPQVGLVELAHESTLFLNEVGDVPPHIQTKLLNALDKGKFRRLGGQKELVSDFRLISATNRDLQQDVATGRFRRDLYERIGGDAGLIKLPPLRHRPEDIPALAARFWSSDSPEGGPARADEVPDGIKQVLQRHSWPGNVRELRNVIDRLKRVSLGRPPTVADLNLESALPGLSEQQSVTQRSRHIWYFPAMLRALRTAKNEVEAATELTRIVADAHAIYFGDTREEALREIHAKWGEHKRVCRYCEVIWRRRFTDGTRVPARELGESAE